MSISIAPSNIAVATTSPDRIGTIARASTTGTGTISSAAQSASNPARSSSSATSITPRGVNTPISASTGPVARFSAQTVALP